MNNQTEGNEQQTGKLARELTLFGMIMVAIGSCIGSGIFVTPSQIAALIPSPVLILGVWIIGGLITLTGTLTFGELGSLFPQTGGIYVYLKEAYGSFAGFLYGWAYLFIITPGSIAVLALAFSYYLSYLVPMSDSMKIVTSIIVICVLTTVNVLRAKFGEIFSNIFTTLKLAGILMIIAVALIYGTADKSFSSDAVSTLGQGTLSGFGVALVGVLFSYGGWQHASFLAGETKNAARNLPIAMITGAVVVTIIYLLANTGYMMLLPVSKIITAQKVAAEAVSTVIPWGGKLVAAIIAISTFGTIGIYTLSAPRIYYAMAEDGVFFKTFAKVHPKFRTPVNAIIIQSIWAIVLLVFWKTFENLITYTVSVEWIFFTLAAAGIFIFRKRLKNVKRQYSATWYPVTPIIFVTICTWFIVNITIKKPLHMGIGLACLAIGVPIYLYFKRNLQKKNEEQL